MTTKTIDRTTSKLWLAAIKPPMYSVVIIPVWVSVAIALFEQGQVPLRICLMFLLAAILILAWENLSNDVFDAETGVDINKAHSIVNLTGNKQLIFWIANLLLLAAILLVIAIAWIQQEPTVLGLTLLGCCLAYAYQGPPFRLGYLGVGEVICFISFGPLLCATAYYSLTRTLSWPLLAASVIVGVATSLILFCSHFHQIKDDAAVGKRSPIVRLGTQRSANLLPWVSGSLYVLTVLFVVLQVFPPTTLLIVASLPLALHLSRHVSRYHDQPERVSNCKFIAVGLHFWSGLLLGLGFLLAGAL
jgi:1,4-dihydroxy-2-naphthoate octaprenyltransferase